MHRARCGAGTVPLSSNTKNFLVALTILLIAGGVYLYNTPEYRVWLERKSDQMLPDAVTHHKMYRWRDAKGQWQLSDKPPADGTKYEIVEYHKDTNVIPSERLTGKSKE
jgi:hypothetical protein